MEFLALESIATRLSEHEYRVSEKDVSGNTPRRAAVAAILRENQGHIEALFILRAIKEGDPWSGQMAFPGGHLETSDASLRHAAERECFEEIGLDLVAHADYLGPVMEVKVNPRGRNIDMIVSPFVYLLQSQDPPIALNYEVAEVLWGSLSDMYTGSNKTELQFSFQGSEQTFPGYTVGDQIVWGLTRTMLRHLFTMINPNWTD